MSFNTIPDNPGTPLDYDHPTVKFLISAHGALLSISALAEILDSTPHSVRQSASASSLPAWDIVRAARRRVGRKILYDARVVAKLFENSAA